METKKSVYSNWKKSKRLHANLSEQWNGKKAIVQLRPPSLWQKEYGVEIIELKNGQLQRPAIKEFKTKKSAMIYAKLYMKKNNKN